METKKLFTRDYQRVSSPNPRAYFRHMHADYELLFFLEGDAQYQVEGRAYSLKKGDLLIIKPRSYHFLQLLSPAPYERFVVNFDKALLAPFLQKELDSFGEFYSCDVASFVFRLFAEWKELMESFSEEELDLFVERLIETLLLSLKGKKQERRRPPLANDRLSRVLAFIDEHPELPHTASSLSEKFFVSTSWLTHIFHSELNIPLMQYVKRKRLLYAQALVRSGVPPTEVCLRLDFNDYSTFYRQYKRFFRSSPKKDVH